MKLIASIIFLLVLQLGYGQSQVSFVEDTNVASLMRRWTGVNRSDDTTEGWRVQIITTDDRRKMESAMQKFNSLFPDEKVAWDHVPPYYKVKVGAFETKLQLMHFLNTIKEDFPGAIPIPDRIDKYDFIRI